jgi:TonB family protein
MATELNQTTTLQGLADSTAIIVDRAATPEKVLGQAWLISKGRVATLASLVSNYAEAPFALLVKFPHPGLSYSVRTIQLHPDFNKRECRDYYLSQGRGTLPPYQADNDMATLALDSDTTAPPAERLAEVNRLLSVPMEVNPQDMSGAMRPGDVPAILQSVLSTGRLGVLTMMDERNIPFARLSVKQTRIVRANFRSLYNEVAVCELMWQQPPGRFVFQPQEFRWPPDIPEMNTPTEQLLAEAQRRFEELPQVLDQLGGQESRFVRISPTADFGQIPQQDRWLVERVWETLDGFMPLGKIADRVGADSYSVAKKVYDLASMGLLNIDQGSPFHQNGQLGPLILPAQDLELNTWDALTAFSIDPHSAGPLAFSGNFFGGAHAINAKTLLHTAPVPQYAGAALIMKDGKMVGIHSGAYPLRGVANPPPIALYRMMWVGALNDLGTKRLRTAEVVAAEAASSAETQLQQEAAMIQRTSMRMKSLEHNDQEATAAIPADDKLSPKQMKILGGAGAMFVLGFLMMIISFITPHGGPAPAPTPDGKPAATTTASAGGTTQAPAYSKNPPASFKQEMGDPAAAKIAFDLLGITAPPAGFVFKDSSQLTDPKRSFELVSENKNLDLLIIEWPNQGPLQNLDLLSKHLPFWDLIRGDQGHPEMTGTGAHVFWHGGHFVTNDDNHTMSMDQIGVWDPHKEGKTIIYMVKPVSGPGNGDMDYPANLMETLIAEGEKARAVSAHGHAAALPDGAIATESQLSDYRKKLADLVKSHYKPPAYDVDTNTKVALNITLDSNGNITQINLQPNPSDDFNNALQKAVDNSAPLPAPPKTKSGSYAITVKAHADDITVEEAQ